MTRYRKAAEGMSLDVAPCRALEHTSGRKALVLGKPAAEFFQAAAARLGIPQQEILMVGDDIESEVAGAQTAGTHAAIVKTAKFPEPDLAGP